MEINQRLLKFIEYKGLSVRGIETQSGLSNGTVSKSLRRGGEISLKSLERILQSFSELNPVWLITGNGEMLLHDDSTLESELDKELRAAKKLLAEKNKIIDELNIKILKMTDN